MPASSTSSYCACLSKGLLGCGIRPHGVATVKEGVSREEPAPRTVVRTAGSGSRLDRHQEDDHEQHDEQHARQPDEVAEPEPERGARTLRSEPCAGRADRPPEEAERDER